MNQTVTLDLQATWQNGAASAFSEQLAELGVTLPVKTDLKEIGVLFDATGRDICTVDSNGNRDDAETALVAGYVALAINLAGGFKLGSPERPRSPLSDELNTMLDDWKLRLAAMSQEERDAMYEEQRKSLVRGMTTPCEHGVLDFEQCPQCRAGADHG